MRGVVGLATVPQQQSQSQIPLQAYAIGPLQVSFCFRVESPSDFCICVDVCYDIYFSTFRCHGGCHIHPVGDQPLRFAVLQAFGAYHGRHMCMVVMVIGLHQECTEWLLLPLF